MTIDFYTTEKGGKNTVSHDLNFLQPQYEAQHVLTFKNPSQALVNLLRESGPVPGDDANGASRKKGEGDKKRKKNVVDMEKLGENLVKLQEDDLLYVVQLIHDNKTDDTYTLNDPEGKKPTSGRRTNANVVSRRISRRSIHASRSLHQDAPGLCQSKISLITNVLLYYQFILDKQDQHLIGGC